MSSAEDYFLQVLKPNHEAYFGSECSFASTLNLATTLFHFHEWLWHQYSSVLKERFGHLRNAPEFWEAVERTNAHFGYVRDVANASKHIKLDRRPSTGVTHIARTEIVPREYGAGAFGRGRFGGPDVVCDDKGQPVYFDDCASDLFDYWKSLLEQLTGEQSG